MILIWCYFVCVENIQKSNVPNVVERAAINLIEME